MKARQWVVTLACLFITAAAQAQEYPAKPIRINRTPQAIEVFVIIYAPSD